jgi:hypothetical protein
MAVSRHISHPVAMAKGHICQAASHNRTHNKCLTLSTHRCGTYSESTGRPGDHVTHASCLAGLWRATAARAGLLPSAANGAGAPGVRHGAVGTGPAPSSPTTHAPPGHATSRLCLPSTTATTLPAEPLHRGPGAAGHLAGGAGGVRPPV